MPAPNTLAISVSLTKPRIREIKVMLPTLARALSRFIGRALKANKIMSETHTA
jgi:hypothetical protein